LLVSGAVDLNVTFADERQCDDVQLLIVGIFEPVGDEGGGPYGFAGGRAGGANAGVGEEGGFNSGEGALRVRFQSSRTSSTWLTPKRGHQFVEGDDGRVALAAFEVADELPAEAAFLGERLLRQAGRDAQPRGVASDELAKRQVDLIRLRTTPAQDRAAIRAFMRENGKPYDVMSSSCTTAARAALEAAGFSPSMLRAVMAALTGSVPVDNSPWPGSVAIMAGDQAGAARASYERGSSVPAYVTAPFQRR
jgi:hypothetical protein